jgi:hypothetical protein
MPAYYDREGKRISLLRQCMLASDPGYKLLRTTDTPAGKVISAWIGEDRADPPNAAAPSIFGTIVQHNDGDFDHSVEEFAATVEECLAYHELLVASMSL